MEKKIRVGVVGPGTVGKRVTDAALLHPRMELVGITGRSHSWRLRAAHKRGIPIFVVPDHQLKGHGFEIAGNLEDLIVSCDVVVDATPKGVGAEMKRQYYKPVGVKAVFQGGESADIAPSFTAQVNYDACMGQQFLRVVSCNTTGLARILHAVHQEFGIEEVLATLVRRGPDPANAKSGPVNAVVPTLELPSHHGPDLNTVVPGIKIVTLALKVPTTLMHVHTVVVECTCPPSVESFRDLVESTPRMRLVWAESGVTSTATIIELARDIGRVRGDMPETCVWAESVAVTGNRLYFMLAVHQESIVTPEVLCAIDAVSGFENAATSIAEADRVLGIPHPDGWQP